jgi:hypothetical protein
MEVFCPFVGNSLTILSFRPDLFFYLQRCHVTVGAKMVYHFHNKGGVPVR